MIRKLGRTWLPVALALFPGTLGATVLSPGAVKIALSPAPQSFLNLSQAPLEEKLCGLTTPPIRPGTLGEARLAVATPSSAGGHELKDFTRFQLHAFTPAAGGTSLLLRAADLRLTGPTPYLSTTCGSWRYDLILTPGVAQPDSALLLSPGEAAGAGTFTGQLQYAARLHFTRLDNLVSTAIDLSLLYNVAGSWSLIPAGSWPPPGMEPTDSNLALFVEPQAGQWQPAPVRAVEVGIKEPAGSQLFLQATGDQVAALNP